jgi:hypothetical protein
VLDCGAFWAGAAFFRRRLRQSFLIAIRRRIVGAPAFFTATAGHTISPNASLGRLEGDLFMKNLSRGTWMALAAVIAVPTTVAIAKTMEHGRWRMSPETRSRLEDGRLAMVKAALQLSPDQEKLWQPVEAQVRDSFKAREAKRAEHEKNRAERKAGEGDHKRADLAERFERISQRMAERADRMKGFSTSFKPFYASLSDEQKDVLRPLIHDLSPGFGKRGHGPRWAFGGWGPGGRPWHDHGWRHGGHDGQGPDGQGPGDQGDEPGTHGNGPDNDGGPVAPAPDTKG